MPLRYMTVEDMMKAREDRVRAQALLLEKTDGPLISFTLNIPGPYKVFWGTSYCFEKGLAALKEALAGAGAECGPEYVKRAASGYEALLCVKGDAKSVKAVCSALEDTGPLGRLFDLDVLTAGPGGYPVKLSREELPEGGPRRCLVCGKPARECAARRTHELKELVTACGRRMLRGFVLEAAGASLLKEVSLTPKPGLVDANNSGAHSDMDLALFKKAIGAIEGYFALMCAEGCCLYDALEAGEGEEAYAEAAAKISALGIEAEKAMLKATGGVNTHKGAIYSLGLLSAALGLEYAEYLAGLAAAAKDGPREGGSPKEGEGPEAETPKEGEEPRNSGARAFRKDLSLKAAVLAGAQSAYAKEHADRTASTHGDRVRGRYGAKGARDEALGGFPAVFGTALPEYDESGSWKRALLSLMKGTDDTTVLYRTGPEGLAYMKEQAKGALAEGSSPEELDKKLLRMDEDFIRRNISPGGCADLLSCAMFIKETEESLLDASYEEDAVFTARR